MGKQKTSKQIIGWINAGVKELPIYDQKNLDLAGRMENYAKTGQLNHQNIDAYWEEMLRLMEVTNMPAPLVYATRKTRRMVTPENKQYLTKAELKEWDDAIDEWYANNPNGVGG